MGGDGEMGWEVMGRWGDGVGGDGEMEWEVMGRWGGR